jgi:hypothetical protein
VRSVKFHTAVVGLLVRVLLRMKITMKRKRTWGCWMMRVDEVVVVVVVVVVSVGGAAALGVVVDNEVVKVVDKLSIVVVGNLNTSVVVVVEVVEDVEVADMDSSLLSSKVLGDMDMTMTDLTGSSCYLPLSSSTTTKKTADT